MFVSVKMANNVVSNANETVATTQHPACSTDISFVSNQKLQSLFNQAEVLGSISMPEGLQSQLRAPGPLPSVDTTQTNTTSHESQSSLSLIKVKNSKKYTVREKYETDIGCIKSFCELDDGTIIMSCVSKLKRMNSYSFKVRDSCIVPLNPEQVCTISSHEVAVCCDSSCLIQFVSIGHTMQTTRQIKTGIRCVGLAYNDEKLFISDRFPSVYVYTLTGERLQQINKPGFFDWMFAANNNFVYSSIAVSSDGSTIYIPHLSKGLIILNKNGQLVGEFNDSKLSVASSVCLYKNDSVLVCGMFSQNVLQFTPDGKLIGEILKRDTRCHALWYCKKTSKLIVGCYEGIEVHDINE